MRFRFAVYTGLGIIIIFCFGCYEPKGEAPFTKVGPAAPLDITVVLTDTTSNIYIYDVTRIQYQTLSKGSVVNNLGSRLTIVLDDKQIFPDTSVPNTIVIDPKQLADGKHKLTFYLDQTNATASSLASSLGKENFYEKKEVTVTVDLTLPDPVAIRKFQITDGVMSVIWNKPSKFNFNSYAIRRFVMNEGSTQWFEYGSAISVNKNAVSFRDSLYSGGPVRYRVDMRGPSSERLGTQRDTTIVMLNPKVERTAIDGIHVSWDKPVLYGTMKDISVKGPSGTVRTLNPETISYDDQLPFGVGASISINITPKYFTFINSFYFVRSFDLTVFYEGLGQTFYQTVPLSFGAKEIIPAITYSGLPTPLLTFYEVNSSTGKIINSISYNDKLSSSMAAAQRANYRVVASADGHRLYVFFGTQVLQFDENLLFIKSIDISPALGGAGDLSVAINISVSNNGLAALRTALNPGGASLFDLENAQLLYWSPGPGSIGPVVSADGRYFVDAGKVYTVTGSTLTVIVPALSAPSDIKQMLFAYDNSDKLMILYPTRIDFLDVPSGIVSSTFAPAAANFSVPLAYNSSTGLLGVVNTDPGSSRQYMLYNTSTNTLSRTILIGGIGVNLIGNELVSAINVRYPL